MTSKLIIAAAGAGKTTYLVDEASKCKEKRILITTFTDENELEIKRKFIELCGGVPSNVIIQTWFSFLLQHGVKPYQGVIYDGKITGLQLVNNKSGLRFTGKYGPIYFGEDDTKNFYFNKSQQIYSDKLAKFVCSANLKTKGMVVKRISEIFSTVFIDEIQDLAGYDLEILKLFLKNAIKLLMVGDPRQVTYHTHNEVKYKKYSSGGIKDFLLNVCRKYPVTIDDTTLNRSYRNPKDICALANELYLNFAPCKSANSQITGHDGVFFVEPEDVDTYLKKYNPIQLRYSAAIKVNSNYSSRNFGVAKGLTFDRVLIYPTRDMDKWLLNHSTVLKDKTKSQLYVAITRAKYSVGIVHRHKKDENIDLIQNFKVNE